MLFWCNADVVLQIADANPFGCGRWARGDNTETPAPPRVAKLLSQRRNCECTSRPDMSRPPVARPSAV
jgi:hypothetical protein